MPKPSMSSGKRSHCCDSRSGIWGRWALYSSNSSWRKVFSRASHAVMMLHGSYSLTIFMSIWLRP